jgi:MoxR-like ATPase
LNLAILTKEHVLFSGAPGTAKSLQANLFFQNFNATTFSVQLSKFSTEEILYGPINITKLKKGMVEYMYENSLLTADFAFIDEIFDASDVLLRSLLGVLNEREFSKGNFHVDVPLITTVATANYVRSNEVTEAVVDRFLFQYHVDPVRDKSKLLNFETPIVNNELGLEQLQSYQEEIPKIKFSRDFQIAYINICEQFGFSDRRIVKGMNVLKANAFLQGRDEVNEEDFKVIRFMVGLKKEQNLEAEEHINEVIGNTLARNQQLKELEIIEKAWDSNTQSHITKKHLTKELNLLKQIKQFNPIDEIVEESRDKMLADYFSHFESNRKTYIQKFDLGKLLNAADFQ